MLSIKTYQKGSLISDCASLPIGIGLEQCKSSERIYNGRILNLRVDQVILDDGTSATREVVEHRGATAVVPILEDGRIVLVRQYRYAATTDLLEIPAGTLEPNERPENCAVRELEEETGYRAGKLEKMFEAFMAPGYATEKIHFFIAEKLVQSEMKTEEDERIVVERTSIDVALDKIRRGEIKDAKTICGLYRASELIRK